MVIIKQITPIFLRHVKDTIFRKTVLFQIGSDLNGGGGDDGYP